MKAYVYGSEVIIMDFHLTKKLGMQYARVRVVETGWYENVPVSVIEIR